MPHLQSRAKREYLNPCLLVHAWPAFFILSSGPSPWKGATHVGLDLPTSTIKTIPHRHAHRPNPWRQSPLRLSSQVILSCVKWTTKANHHIFRNILSGQQIMNFNIILILGVFLFIHYSEVIPAKLLSIILILNIQNAMKGGKWTAWTEIYNSGAGEKARWLRALLLLQRTRV